RWLSRDPLDRAEEREGPNLYAYVGNNPIENTDPLGLSWRCCIDEWLAMVSLKRQAREACGGDMHEARRRCKIAFKAKLLTANQLCQMEIMAAAKECGKELRWVPFGERIYY